MGSLDVPKRSHPLQFPLQRGNLEVSGFPQVIDNLGERGRNRTYNLLIKSKVRVLPSMP